MWASQSRSALKKLEKCLKVQVSLVQDARSLANFYSTKIDEYEYLEQSILPMTHFQSSLPRLPIPKLEKTCERYLNAQRPLLGDAEYNRCKNAVNAFLQEGKGLDQELREIDKKNKHTSYITGPWFDMYLRDRRSTVMTHNPGIIITPDARPEYNTQKLKAANMLISSFRFLKSLRDEVLEPDVFHLRPKKTNNLNYRTVMKWTPPPLRFLTSAIVYKAFPLDMSQFVNLLNSTRVPEVSGKDSLLVDSSATHMAIMRNGNFYVFDAIDEQGRLKTPDVILAYVEYILNDKSSPAPHPIGVLTTQDRDTWAKYRAELVNAGNSSQLRLVDTAIFVMNLDNLDTDDNISLLRNFLHSDGSNRWFDKSFQLMISGNGSAAVNFEHAWGDGVAVLRYMNEIYKDSTEKAQVHPGTKPANIDASKHVKKLEWQIPDSVKKGINDAKTQFHKRTSGLAIDILEFKGTGKKFAKQHRISPDALMQMAFQVAYHRVTGKTVATYESCSTAAFKHGRTETMRPATNATKALSEALNSSKKFSAKDIRKMVEECSKYHGQLTKEAAMGQGFDRHLFGLKLMAEKHDTKLPQLYRDPSYDGINYNIISTSTLSSPAVAAGAFAPVVQDGLGLGYGIMDNRLGCVASSYIGHNSGSEFLSSLESVFKDIVESLQKTKSS